MLAVAPRLDDHAVGADGRPRRLRADPVGAGERRRSLAEHPSEVVPAGVLAKRGGVFRPRDGDDFDVVLVVVVEAAERPKLGVALRSPGGEEVEENGSAGGGLRYRRGRAVGEREGRVGCAVARVRSNGDVAPPSGGRRGRRRRCRLRGRSRGRRDGRSRRGRWRRDWGRRRRDGRRRRRRGARGDGFAADGPRRRGRGAGGRRGRLRGGRRRWRERRGRGRRKRRWHRRAGCGRRGRGKRSRRWRDGRWSRLRAARGGERDQRQRRGGEQVSRFRCDGRHRPLHHAARSWSRTPRQ